MSNTRSSTHSPQASAPLSTVSLDDKYTLVSGRAYMTGIQALVRLPIMQRLRDQAAGLNTAGFVTGYRGSPLGNVDQEFWKAKKYLEPHHVRFQPGLNEDLAATAVWGTQQVNLDPNALYDGVFSIWYGKGPGVDRTGDVFRHANAAGTSKHGGVLVIAGDDHGAKSSTLPHQTEHIFKSMMMPVLAPAGIQDYLEYGLHGFALSRYSGCWVAFKALTDTVETSASVNIDPFAVRTIIPADFPIPPDGLNLRWPDPPLVQEKRLVHHKLYAALAYCRANKLNQTIIDSPNAKLGIITSGKSYLDVRQALEDLGIDEQLAAEIGIRLYKVGMVWPLEAEGVREFANGLDEILVIEEKRQFLEYQLKEELYNWNENVRPRVIGKFDEKGEWSLPHSEWMLPAAGDLTPAMIARVIAARIARFYTSDKIKARLAFFDAKEAALAKPRLSIQRVPHYCSGCPHNTSTKVPAGSRAIAGIGCHYMATWLSPETTQTFCQMGGEGVPWVGQAPFTKTPHVFANLGDGTYMHSGILAIRAAVAAKVNITYKILYNDAVAMTGGQPHDGTLSVPIIARQLQAEGIGNIIVVNDGPRAYGPADLPHGVPIRHRDELDAVQRELREVPGVTAIIYDQTCAAEKRRRRKRGKFPDPAMRVVINDLVCEGCGDCSEKSNCMSVAAVETEFGRKRTIDQSACNKDFSCVKGFCPSFVTVEGGKLRKGKAATAVADVFASLPEPTLPATNAPWGILITGVGGTGVVTIGALLGMAAHLEGKGVSILDMAGLAQKGGAVWSHVKIANRPEDIFAARVAAGEANVVIGCDLVVSASDESLAKMRTNHTRVVINRDQSNTSEFVRGFAAQARTGNVAKHPDPQFPSGSMESQIVDAVGNQNVEFLEASRLATAILGDSIATNLFMLGFAWQRGLVPLTRDSILRAIELNGAAIEANRSAFQWGRRAAVDPDAVAKAAKPQHGTPEHHKLSVSVDEVVARRKAFLADYQNAAYAERYAKFVERVRAAEAKVQPGTTLLTEAVARGYHKLLAYKDEYEVARLYTDSDFLKRVEEQFEGDYKLVFHLAPPTLADKDPQTGELQKKKYGPWMLKAMRQLAKMKGLRGTMLDPFARTHDRKLDRQLIADYERVVEEILVGLEQANFETAVELANLPEQIRGFGHIRERYLRNARMREGELLAAFRRKERPTGTSAGNVRKTIAVIPG
ncbi:indolepyruvate ferredoxin oxidoreductase family protein [Aromatoleum toluclasticum]|uniref:indolepyruvate ferredoxin oxidoreductase family protein n=1 Tax=Aromatoleum toluclasticum TaxID=92003 RepID=UPI00035C20ED|nr:indolepyruvate ferredoxin oxidoreductase family protein [Aromatoleum toluclasticum]